MKKATVNIQNQIARAVELLQQGGVIAYPTEAVYGLGCDPKNLSALKKLLALKQRKKDKGLILIASNFVQFQDYMQPLEKNIEEKLLTSWQKSQYAVTWLVPVKKEVSEYLNGRFNTIAIRVSHHPIVTELCQKFNGAIVSTSANISSEEAARTHEQVKQIFGDAIDFIIEGETDFNTQPSEIRDALSDNIIRTNTVIAKEQGD